jgi:hypothetical protein
VNPNAHFIYLYFAAIAARKYMYINLQLYQHLRYLAGVSADAAFSCIRRILVCDEGNAQVLFHYLVPG